MKLIVPFMKLADRSENNDKLISLFHVYITSSSSSPNCLTKIFESMVKVGLHFLNTASRYEMKEVKMYYLVVIGQRVRTLIGTEIPPYDVTKKFLRASSAGSKESS